MLDDELDDELGGTFHDLLYPKSGLVADHKAFIKRQAARTARRYGLDPIEVEHRAIAIAVAAEKGYSPDLGSFGSYLFIRFKELHRVHSEINLLVPTGVTEADIKAEKAEAAGERVDVKFPDPYPANSRGPRLYIDKQWHRVWDFTGELFNNITPGAWDGPIERTDRRAPWRKGTARRILNFGNITARDIKRIVVGIQLRLTDAAHSLHERIATHVIPLAQLFDGREPATFRGWTRACVDHFLRRYREADQEAINADYKPVFLEAERSTVHVGSARPRRMERPLSTHVRPVSLDAPITTNGVDGPGERMTLKDVIAAPTGSSTGDAIMVKAEALLPRLKGNERAVFEALLTGGPMTTQRDLANATGLSPGAVSKILCRIAKVAQK
jgi:hypothetical protein